MFGQSYTAPLLLANAGKSAMKVLVAARPELAEWITFTPDFGFIQVGLQEAGHSGGGGWTPGWRGGRGGGGGLGWAGPGWAGLGWGGVG